MATQGIQYTVSLNDPSVIAAFGRMENSANSFERSISGIGSSLSKLGLSLGLREIYEFGKGMVHVAADYETSMLRIKNASSGASEGIKNQLFIKDEADKFKIDLQEAADAYGRFLLKTKNAGLSADASRRLEDNILTVSKVAALPNSEMQAAVNNVSILLGEGILEARHLRGLSAVHPQLVPFLAEEMGLKSGQRDAFSKILHGEHDDATMMQKISLLMSGGKLTKMAIDARIVIEAFEKYRKSVESGLPETLTTIQSGLNEIGTAWTKFQSELVIKGRPELNHLFDGIKEGITWLREHEDGLIKYGEIIANLAKIWIEYKVAMGGIALLQGGWSAIFGSQTTGITAQTSATAALNGELVLMNTNLETLIGLQADLAVESAALGGIGIAGAAGGAISAKALTGAFNLPINMNGVAGAAAGASAGLGATLIKGAVPVVVTYFAAEALLQFANANFLTGEKFSVFGKNGVGSSGLSQMAFGKSMLEMLGFDFNVQPSAKHGLVDSKDYYGLKKPDKYGFQFNDNPQAQKTSDHIVPANDKITGQRVITYNITVNGGVNGQKIDKQIIEKSADFDINTIMEEVARGLEAVTNDSQLHGND